MKKKIYKMKGILRRNFHHNFSTWRNTKYWKLERNVLILYLSWKLKYVTIMATIITNCIKCSSTTNIHCIGFANEIYSIINNSDKFKYKVIFTYTFYTNKNWIGQWWHILTFFVKSYRCGMTWDWIIRDNTG